MGNHQTNISTQKCTVYNLILPKLPGKWYDILSEKYYCINWNLHNSRLRVTFHSNNSTEKGYVNVNNNCDGKLELQINSSTRSFWIHWTDYERFIIVSIADKLCILARSVAVGKDNIQLLLLAAKGLGLKTDDLIKDCAVSQKETESEDFWSLNMTFFPELKSDYDSQFSN